MERVMCMCVCGEGGEWTFNKKGILKRSENEDQKTTYW